MLFGLTLLAIYVGVGVVSMIGFIYWGDRAENADDYHN